MTVQTTYDRAYGAPFQGSPANTALKQDASLLNSNAGDMPAGIAVKLASEGKADLMGAASDVIAGISLNTTARDPGNGGTVLSGDNAIRAGDMFNAREFGATYVLPEQTVTPTDPVFVRFTSDGGSNTQVGKFRKDADSGRARLVQGARWMTGGSTTSPCMLHFDANAEQAAQKTAQASRRLVLTAAAEGGNAIVVSGQIQDLQGTPVSVAKEVLFRALGTTDAKGHVTVTTGVSKKVVNPATGESVAWLESTAAGAFAVSVADDQVEDCMVHASTEDGLTAMLKITFA